ncbi:hypothetical protein JIN84_10810 [Luteolibacter yonseiensis]|uniref:Uncharacterized protein n=1 Tax=Luteolibacter yonseiensis TaxID=1144680 RepID=A0A934R4Y7_9BACT|nr:hypothetical protein [Luteolibacter yonseiensis]MBK1816103.1 hypothetical protein [Luteolibacter yonseiensis]
MRTSSISLPSLVGGFCGFIAAAAIGWSMAGDSSAPAVPGNEVPVTSGKNERVSRPSRQSAGAALAEKRLAPVRAAGNPEARMRATIDLANSLPVSDFAAWIDGGFFNLRGGAELTLFSKIQMERWMKEDPEGLVGWSMKNNSYQSREILAKWADKEPQRVIDFFKTHPDNAQEIGALHAIAKDHPDLALRRFQELAAAGISSNRTSEIFSLMLVLAEKSPAALEATLASLPSALYFEASCALSGQRLKASFATEIRALWEEPDGWKIFAQNTRYDRKSAAAIFDELANIPPAWRSALASDSWNFMDESTAGKWLDADLTGLGFTPEQEKSLKKSALGRMDRNKPEEALKRMTAMGLNEDERKNVISNIIYSSNHDPEKVETIIGLLGTEEDQKYARSLLQSRSDQENGNTPKTPDEWLAKVGDLDVKNNSGHSLIEQMQNWDSGKMAELKSQFSKMPDEKKQVVAQIVAKQMSYGLTDSGLTGDAIRYLVSHPVEVSEESPNTVDVGKSPSAMTSGYAVRLATRSPDEAAEWVRSLPAGDAKSWAEKNLATSWAQYDPKAVEQWLKTLPAASREEVRKHMNKN